MKELHDILGAMTAQKDKVPDRKELLLDMSERVVKAVSAAFTCKADEVAILVLTSDGKHLRFIAPRKFTDLGTIPITKRDSIAVTVLGKKSGEAMNNVPLVKGAHPEDDHGPHPVPGSAAGGGPDQPQGGDPGGGRTRLHARRRAPRPGDLRGRGPLLRRGAAPEILSRGYSRPGRMIPESYPVNGRGPTWTGMAVTLKPSLVTSRLNR